jgi:hypothetical protein
MYEIQFRFKKNAWITSAFSESMPKDSTLYQWLDKLAEARKEVEKHVSGGICDGSEYRLVKIMEEQ